jgi:hypothetical protein
VAVEADRAATQAQRRQRVELITARRAGHCRQDIAARQGQPAHHRESRSATLSRARRLVSLFGVGLTCCLSVVGSPAAARRSLSCRVIEPWATGRARGRTAGEVALLTDIARMIRACLAASPMMTTAASLISAKSNIQVAPRAWLFSSPDVW